MDHKWGITQDMIKDESICPKLETMWNKARSTMLQRTGYFELFGRVAHNQSIFDRKRKNWFSEGSTQAIMRKVVNSAVQRVPDGELITQYDKNSWQQIFLEWAFENKILYSEWDGRSMYANLIRTTKSSFKYCFGAVYTGFEKDLDGDVRVTYERIPWNDIYPDPDADYIEQAQSYIVRRYIDRATLIALLNEDGELKDSGAGWNELTVKYLIEHGMTDGGEANSLPLADNMKGVTKIQSIETRTIYKRGEDEFVTYVPRLNAILRTVKNHVVRNDVPLEFLILEPDDDFPLGIPQILYLMPNQQFADAFQSVAFQEMLIGINPPLQVWGNLVNSKLRLEPGAIWPMGTNPNQGMVQPYKVENGILTQYAKILENVRGNQLNSLQMMDGTMASEASNNYSATPQGVNAQENQRTVTMNSYQKPIEEFFSSWCNKALNMYINSMSGEHWVTVDEETRRRIWDVGGQDLIDENKLKVDFNELKSGSINFVIRTGSLVENRVDQERRAITEALAPLPQMVAGMSDQWKPVLEERIIRLLERLMELSDIDVSQETANELAAKREEVMMQALMATMDKVQGMEQQQNMTSQGLSAVANQMPPEAQQAIQAQMQEAMQQQEQPQLPPDSRAEAIPQGEPAPVAPAPGQGVPAEFPPDAGEMPELSEIPRIA